MSSDARDSLGATAERSFAELLIYHLERGTRPSGVQRRWAVKEFAGAVGRKESAVRNWLKGRNSPPTLGRIEIALFGEEQPKQSKQYLDWRVQLRDSFKRAHEARVPASTRGLPALLDSDNDACLAKSFDERLRALVIFAEGAAHDRQVAEGFINEMAAMISSDRCIDFYTKMNEVRNAIDMYVKEVRGQQIPCDIDKIAQNALQRALAYVDSGRSGLALSIIQRAAEEVRDEEAAYRRRYVATITALYNKQRDIALATYNGEAVAVAIVRRLQAIHSSDVTKIFQSIRDEGTALYRSGDQQGSNVRLVAAIALRRSLLGLTRSIAERREAEHDLGVALWTLGERESGTARLEEAEALFRATLDIAIVPSKPPSSARVRCNLGAALVRLAERGEEHSKIERLESALSMFEVALVECDRDGEPLLWATAQYNRGAALFTLGLDLGVATLEKAVLAFYAALIEYTPENNLSDWIYTQANLGATLWAIGDRTGDTAKLQEAIKVLRAALKECVRDREPLQRADVQHNLANALSSLGEREKGTRRLKQAVAFFQSALDVWSRDLWPAKWAMAHFNLGLTLMILGSREAGTVQIEKAVEAFQQATKEGSEKIVNTCNMNIQSCRRLINQRRGGFEILVRIG